ncbi:MAG: PAS domain-containing protein [Nitrosopumilus sp.]|jgi:PAS domain S-box-containing protein
MPQTEARKTLKDAPIMWRRINSIGMILDCNSTYAANLGYAKSEILGKPIFEHVSKESWGIMNDSLKVWFETGKVTDRKITFIRQDKTIFSGLLQATSLYDENKNVLGSNTVIFDLTQMTDENIKKYELFFIETNERLDEIKEKEYDQLDKNSKSEYDGLKEMFQMLLEIDLKKLK